MKKIGFPALALAAAVLAGCDDLVERDVVVYGSSPAALTAAIAAQRLGKSVVIVSPETRIGGLTSGGLGQTDIGNKQAFGGLALQFYRDVAAYYRDEANWTRQKRSDYLPDGQCRGTKGEDSMWTFEPSAALKVLEGWERRYGLDIHRGKRLDRSKGQVRVEGPQRKIKSFKTEDGTEYRGGMFVDATYEGDLMAAAGVTYFVGREDNSVYGETLNGCQPDQGYHRFADKVDPYVVKGDKSSGLLPCIDARPLPPTGTGDANVQAYCYRMCLTDDPANRIPFAKPANYRERDYELLLRNFEAGEKRLPWINSKMPNRKTDTNNARGFSTDFIGQNWSYPEASYAEREKILRAHLAYQQGLMWTLANHPRVPEGIRTEVARWGTCKDEFADGFGNGWQRQLYVREARRLVGEYVMTEHECRQDRVVSRPVAMAAYGMDSHHSHRYVNKDGFVQNEGDVEVGCPKGPYGIDYGALVPKRAECGNLFVPVCLSASHIAFGSIRMEPVFFALGQAAGTAAAQALDAGCCVQDVPYAPLRERLVADGQVVELAKEDFSAPVRPIGVNGQPAWNVKSRWFVYAPTFGFAEKEGAAGYRFDTYDLDGRRRSFTADRPTAALSPVWREIPYGPLSVTCTAVRADGSAIGVCGARSFRKQYGYEPEPRAYPPAKRGYGETAKLICGYLTRLPIARRLYVERRTIPSNEVTRANQVFIAYPCKMAAALARTAAAGAASDGEVRTFALGAGDYLLSITEPQGAPLAGFPRTYQAHPGLTGHPAGVVAKKGDRIMMIYPAEAGSAYLALFRATKDAKWLSAATAVADRYLALQGADGTWPLNCALKDGRATEANRLVPTGVITFLEELHAATGKPEYRQAADRAFACIDTTRLVDWNWEGQFEDVGATKPYQNLTKHGACSTAMYLLKRFPGDPARLRQAREILRFAEDQFVCWRPPLTRWPDGRIRENGGYAVWRCPAVLEQYSCYLPIDASAAKLINTYLALYEAAGDSLDLAKARTLGDAMTRETKDDGFLPTFWSPLVENWPNCAAASAAALQTLAHFTGN